MASDHERAQVPERLQRAGGLRPGTARQIAVETGVPEAEVYGVGSFFHLLAEPDVGMRVCTGLSCRLAGSAELLAHAQACGFRAEGAACLAACDRAPATLLGRSVTGPITRDDLERAGGAIGSVAGAATWDGRGAIGPDVASDRLAIDLGGMPDFTGRALARAAVLGPSGVVAELAAAQLQGRGGAGFPAAQKWEAVLAQPEPLRYVVLNADEGEPGTFKDREVMVRRPDRVIEGLAIAARVIGAREVYLYVRGEFEVPWNALAEAIDGFAAAGHLDGLSFHFHAGHGAYICGEETALLEALEGKRGMPRLRPPYPTERGLWGRPTLIHNVETLACVPAILERGGAWFAALGRTGPGTKLYSISGHIERPGTYEMPLGVSLDELVEVAGGGVGELKAFSPGGASSGFLPASESGRPLDFAPLAQVGSMLGSAGVVVMNHTVDLRDAAAIQLAFFEAESCGQCAPCRIGTRLLGSLVERARHDVGELAPVEEIAWEMDEGSICGLGQAAPLPLTSAMRWFPGDFDLA